MSPDDDDADPASGGSEPDAADRAISYPRGNRLGIRHPRPTVVIVAAVVILVAVAYAWSTLSGR